MTKRTILFLSALGNSACEQQYACPDGSTVSGTQTNEAPVKYLLRLHPDMREIVCVVTSEAKNTAWDHFEREVHACCGSVKLTEVALEEDQELTGTPLAQIMQSFEKEDELFFDTTGGFRNAVMQMLLISRILTYKGIKLNMAVYANNRAGRIEDVSGLFEDFDLVGGMQELTDLGNVRTLRSYYERHSGDEKIDRMITALERLTESITLCRTSQINERLAEFIDAINDAKECSDPLMRQLLPIFRNRFDKKLSPIGLIKWCVNSGMIQQALTLYTELVPGVILGKDGGIVQVTDESRRAAAKSEYSLFTEDFLKLPERLENFSGSYTVTVNNLERLLAHPRSGYRAQRPIEEIQDICRDYIYIKQIRNNTNHADNLVGFHAQNRDMENLIEHGYPEPDSVGLDQLGEIILTGIERLRTKAKGEKKK